MKNKGIKRVLLNGFVRACKDCKLGWPIVLLIAAAFAVKSGDLINKVYNSSQSKGVKEQVSKFKDYATIVNIIFPNIVLRWILFVLAFLIIMVIVYVRYFYEGPKEKPKRDVNILGHISMSATQLKVSDEYLERNNVYIEPIDLREDMKQVGNNYEKIQNVIQMQDSLVEKFKNKISGSNQYGYMGIADTPLILRAGYKIGDETKFLIFHKERNKEFFEELEDAEILMPMEVESRKIVKESKELIVAISTTFDILDHQLSVLHPEHMSVIKFQTCKKGYDVINSDKQIHSYVTFLLDEIRQIVRKNGITKIHMVISSSVAFTFALGQRMSSRYDVETVIYQYDLKADKLYPWGISLFNDYSECVVIN